MEIIITLGIIFFTAFVVYRTFKKSSTGNCNCGTCSTNCPMYKDKDTTIKIQK